MRLKTIIIWATILCLAGIGYAVASGIGGGGIHGVPWGAVPITGGTINNTILGDKTPAAASFTTLLNAMNSNATKTDTYVVLTADLGKTLIMNSGDAKIFTTPSVAAGDIGAHLKFIKIGTGMLTIQMADSDTVGDSGAGDTVYCGDTGIATIEIELVSATAWAIISVVNEPSESWITTD